MARVKVDDKAGSPSEKGGGLYFGKPNTSLQFIKSGSKLLDLALGGGWARRRISNVVGNKAVGKTLIAIEAAANFSFTEPKGIVRYREAESAFDPHYAEALGFPLDKVDFGDPIETVEDLFEDLTSVVSKSKGPEFYIVDSLDALSDRSEMERDMDQGSYGAEKAKKMSQLFRRLVRQLESKDVTLMIISQIRDNVGGGMFAKKYVRSGGRSLDFYASQILMLTELKKLDRTISNIKRIVGVEVQAKVEKSKVGLPYREVQFPIMFGFGIDDRKANTNFLKTVSGVDLKDTIDDAELKRMVENKWWELENKFLPKRSKYQLDGD